MGLQWQIWDRIRAFARKANIYRTDNIYQDQGILDRIIAGGDFINLANQGSLLEQTNLQINRLERYKDYDMMDETGEITLALDMYSDESSLVDSERKHSVIVRAKNKRLKETIEDFLYNTILIDREIRPIIRYLCKYGDFPAEIIPTANRDGVSSFRFMNVYNFTRVQTKFGDLIGFYYQDPGSGGPIFLHPWQAIHMRLTTFESQYHPYGRSVLDGGRKDFKRLRLMEDAALIYRITRAPEKRIFSIPVGNLAPQQVPQYIELIARQMKKYKFVDPATGQVNERYSPLIQEDDFWLPKRSDGTGPTVDTLPGAENLDAIADIEYFKKKMVAGLKIPFSRLGIGEQSESDGKSLASVSPEFAKNIQWVQREAIMGLKKLVIVHLALRGHTIDEIKSFDLSMTAASAIDELYRIETWNTRADVMSALKDTKMFTDRWILQRFTDMTEDEIAELERQKAETTTPVAESTDPDERRLMLEYAAFEKRLSASRKLTLDMNKDFERFPGNSPNASVNWFVNSKELDGLSKKDAEIVPVSVDKAVIEEVRRETELLLEGGESTEVELEGVEGDLSVEVAEIAKKPALLMEGPTDVTN